MVSDISTWELRVVLLDPDAAAADQEATLLSDASDDIRVVAICSDVQKAIDSIARYQPGLVIADAAAANDIGSLQNFVDAAHAAYNDVLIAMVAEENIYDQVAAAGQDGLDIFFLAPKPVSLVADAIMQQLADVPRQQPISSPESLSPQQRNIISFARQKKPAATNNSLDGLQQPANPVPGPYRLNFESSSVRRSVELQGSQNIGLNHSQLQTAAEGLVIAVYAPKGGVGKTTLAVNLAAAALAVGRPELKIAIADLDVAAIGGVLSTLAITNVQYGLSDVLMDAVDLSKAMAVKTVGMSQLSVLPGLRSPAEAESANSQAVSKLIDDLRNLYDVIVLDVGDDITRPSTQAAIAAADKVLIPSETTTQSVVRTLAAAKKLAERQASDFAQKAQVVLTKEMNRKPRKEDEFTELLGKLEIGQPLRIPFDKAVREAEAAGQPVTAFAPRSQVAKAYLALARQVLPADLLPQEEKRGRLFGGGGRKVQHLQESDTSVLSGWFS